MRRLGISRLIVLVFILFSGSCKVKDVVRFKTLPEAPIPEIKEELRGVWVTRFDWVDSDPEVCRSQIENIIKEIYQSNFNAVFFQVRGQAETLYPSHLESWSIMFEHKDPGFDPLDFAIKEAHKYELKFYAYVNLLPLWGSEVPPADSNHLYYKHGPGASEKDSWLCFDGTGKPMQLNEYYYMNPALPSVKTYLKEVMVHLISEYNLDGIHFDRIRYPGPDYIFDPYSIKRYHSDSIEFGWTTEEWARQQLTDLVEDVVAEVLLYKPYLSISAATWGLYRTDDIQDYNQFRSGYEHYYQDALAWLDRGIMDFIVPMIYWDISDPSPNFHELWSDFKSRTKAYKNIYPGLIVKEGWLEDGETASQIHFIRENTGYGHVLFSFRAIEGSGNRLIKRILYPNPVSIPSNLNRRSSTQVLSFVLPDSYVQENHSLSFISDSLRTYHVPDQDNKINMIFHNVRDSLSLFLGANEAQFSLLNHRPPFRFTVDETLSVSRAKPILEYRGPQFLTTSNPDFYPLFKTDYPAFAEINDSPVKIYKTGVFFDHVNLVEGSNRIRAQVFSKDTLHSYYEPEILYKKKVHRPSLPLWIDERSITPSVDHILTKDDFLRLSFDGSLGQAAVAIIEPGGREVQFSRTDYDDFSIYHTDLPMRILSKDVANQLYILLKSNKNNSQLKIKIPANIELRFRDEFPKIKTDQRNNQLEHSLGPIRLGSPIIAEYDSGVILNVSGVFGDYYRIELDRNTDGFIHRRFVKEMSEGTVRPGYFVQAITTTPKPGLDVIHIPYPEAVPYAVVPDPENKIIKISLFGVKTSSTWIVHKTYLENINRITWQQITPETYQVILHLNTTKIWGYELKAKAGVLEFRLKHAPSLLQTDSLNPYKGLKIAIEAGHGGSSTGAMGLSGLLEKDINLDLAVRLEKICLNAGMEVLQVRDEDRSMSLEMKRSIVEASDADLFVSLHANSGNTSRGYLRVAGTSTYYHNPYWAPLANLIYDRLLELGLDEFGVVGSFNYTPTRMSSRPAVLVEQAFMSHAEDEEKLYSAEFRQKMAEKIFEGLIDYLGYMFQK